MRGAEGCSPRLRGGRRGGGAGRGGPGRGRGGPGEAVADALTGSGCRAGGRAAASMVLVLHHILIAVVQFLRRGQQVFLKPDEPPPQPCADSLQKPVPTGRKDARLEDVLLSLGSVINIVGWQQAVKEALSAVLPRVETVYTYLLDRESRLVCEDPHHELPQEGKVREAVISRKRLGCKGLGPSDLPGKPLARLVAPLPPDSQVLVIPLVDKEAGAVAAVILVRAPAGCGGGEGSRGGSGG
ncbi:hypothetical protein MC885_009596 [Smutsia gigantea]|nr:hypothetical protein MC885_009596 [Smutsia gigantea]